MNQNPSRPLPVSVLIVTYNSADDIGDCLASLLPQVRKIGGDVLIVDNASTDDTIQLIRQEAKDSTCLTLIENRKNRGFAIANNQALAQAKGEHVFYLNPDTVLQEAVLSGLLDVLNDNKELGAVAPQLQFPDGTLQKSCRRFPTHWDVITHFFGLSFIFPRSRIFNAWKMGDFDHLTERDVDQPAGAALMVRGSVLRDLGGLDVNFPMFFNDVDLCLRIKSAGFQIRYVPRLAIYHRGGASVKRNKFRMIFSSHVSFFRYFEKHYTRIHEQLLNLVVGVLLYASILPRVLWLLLGNKRSGVRRDVL